MRIGIGIGIGIGNYNYLLSKSQLFERAFSFERKEICEDYYLSTSNVNNIILQGISHIYYSSDSGFTWTEAVLPLSNPINLKGQVLWKVDLSDNIGFAYIQNGSQTHEYKATERGILFNYSGQIIRDYYFNLTTITALEAKDVVSLEYSYDNLNWVTITLPWTVSQVIDVVGDVYWRATFSKQTAYLYLQTDNFNTQNTQERVYFCDKYKRIVRDYYYNPIRINKITTNVENLEFTYDYITWYPLIVGSVLFDNIWIRTNTDILNGYISIIGDIDTDVYEAGMLAGQSNALGDNIIMNDSKYIFSMPPVYTASSLASIPSGSWEILNEGVNTNPNNLRGGCEAGYVRKHIDTYGTKFLFYYKNAIGGSSLAADWLPIESGYYNSRIKLGLIPKLQELFNRKVKFNFVFFKWFQGESDAGVAARANAYYSNLNILLDQLFLDLQEFCATNGLVYIKPIVILTLIKTGVLNENIEYKTTVRNAMSQYANENTKVFTIDADNYKELSLTGVHHYSEELRDMGFEQFEIIKNNK